MRIRIFLCCLMCLLSCVVPSALAQNIEHDQTIAPNAIYSELGGKGGLYGIFYERLIVDRLGLGIGFSNWSFWFFSDINITVIPLFVSWYPIGENNRLYLDLGADWVSAEVGTSKASQWVKARSGLLGVAGLGYAYRPEDNGLFFKVGPMLFFSGAGSQIWGNLSAGYAF